MSKTFYLLGEITNESLGIIEDIMEHKREVDDDREIKVVISSEGGDESVGYAIYDALVAYSTFGHVTTVGYGQVCSIASLVLQAGNFRLLSPNCVFMIHNGSVEVVNSVDSKMLAEIAHHFKVNNERYYACLAKRCGIPVDKVRKWCDDERFFSAEEAIKAKFADKIVKEL